MLFCTRVIKAALCRLTCQPLPDRSDVYVLWNEHGPQNAARVLQQRGDQDGFRYLNELICGWTAYAASRCDEIDREQQRLREKAERIMLRQLRRERKLRRRPDRPVMTARRPDRARDRGARTRRSRRALRRSSARSSGRSAGDSELADPAGTVA